MGKASALAFPILVHGLYDFPLMALGRMQSNGRSLPSTEESLAIWLLALFLVVLSVEVVWAYRLMARLRRQQLQEAYVAGAAERPDHPAHKALVRGPALCALDDPDAPPLLQHRPPAAAGDEGEP